MASIKDVAKGAFISFDPNYRETLIAPEDLAAYLAKVRSFIAVADFVKIREEELTLITDETDIRQGAQQICALGAKYLAVTLGKEGTLLQSVEAQAFVGSIAIKQIDSTGAGDAFTGGILYQIQKSGVLTCTKYGAIPALPTLEEVGFALGK